MMDGISNIVERIGKSPFSCHEDSILFDMDCMEALPFIPDNFFELAIVDVPYGIGDGGLKNPLRINKKKPGFGGKVYKPFADMHPPGSDYWSELFRVSKNQIIWGANHFISKLPRKDSSCWIVWDKDNGESHFADCELAWASFKSAVRKFRYKWNGMYQEDMKNKEVRIHPAQKPVKLYEWLLMKYGKLGDKVLDTHVGSGSSRIAAYRLGFAFTGFEIDRYYCEESTRRFLNEADCLKINFEKVL